LLSTGKKIWYQNCGYSTEIPWISNLLNVLFLILYRMIEDGHPWTYIEKGISIRIRTSLQSLLALVVIVVDDVVPLCSHTGLYQLVMC
ncbi:hypothetical protein LINPERHAP2_LOCUS34944, partial [Linum perenne]